MISFLLGVGLILYGLLYAIPKWMYDKDHHSGTMNDYGNKYGEWTTGYQSIYNSLKRNYGVYITPPEKGAFFVHGGKDSLGSQNVYMMCMAKAIAWDKGMIPFSLRRRDLTKLDPFAQYYAEYGSMEKQFYNEHPEMKMTKDNVETIEKDPTRRFVLDETILCKETKDIDTRKVWRADKHRFQY